MAPNTNSHAPADEDASPTTAPRRASRRTWAGLALLLLPMLALATDLTVVFFAMPTLSLDLQPTSTQGLWIVHAYGFLIAGFLMTMGRLGDRIGPRRLLLAGAAAFAALSTVAATAGSAEVLIATRAALGIAGATLMPSLFSLLRSMFPDEQQRRLAIAIMFSAFSAGGAIGPLLGGALLERFWWGSVFLVNVPPMLLLLALGPRLLPERRQRETARLDGLSVLLSVTGMLAVVFGLQELAAATETDGTAWPYLGIVAAGGVVLWGFVRRQRRHPQPLFDLSLLTERRIAVPLATLLLVGVGVVGIFFLFTQHLQWVADLSPLQAGIWTLPYIVLNIAGALIAPRLASTWRSATVVAHGLTVAALGTTSLAVVIQVEASLPWLVAAVAVSAFGQGAAMALLSDLIISSAPANRAGSAAAAQEVGGELGTALGVAAGGAIGLVAYQVALPGAAGDVVPVAVVQEATASVHDGLRAASEQPELLAAVHEAVSRALQTYAGVATVLIGAAAVLVTATLVQRGGSLSTATATELARAVRPETANSGSEAATPDDRLLFRNTMRITPGHLDDFVAAIRRAVDFAERHAPQLLVDVYLDADGLRATSLQLYADSSSVLRQWELSDPYIAEVMRHCTVERFEVFGSPSPEVRAGLRRSAASGVVAVPRLVGFLR